MRLASRMVQCALGASVLVAAGSAMGEPVRFDVPLGNPQFPNWWMQADQELDLTQSYEDNIFGPTWEPESTFESLMIGGMGGYYSPQEGLAAGPGFYSFKGVLTTPGDEKPLAVPLQFGATIDENSGTYTRDGYYHAGRRGAVDPNNPFPLQWFYYESNFTVDETAYVGLKFLIDDEVHYGWVEVIMTGTEPVVGTTQGNGVVTYVRAWGYETEPGVPAVAGVPAPASTTLIGLAGIAAVRRRR